MSSLPLEQQLAETPWCDVELRSIAWCQGRDLLLTLLWPDPARPEGARRTLRASWTSNLQIDLSYREDEGGYPLTWDVTFARMRQGWTVSFDFARRGRLSFQCVELELS